MMAFKREVYQIDRDALKLVISSSDIFFTVRKSRRIDPVAQTPSEQQQWGSWRFFKFRQVSSDRNLRLEKVS